MFCIKYLEILWDKNVEYENAKIWLTHFKTHTILKNVVKSKRVKYFGQLFDSHGLSVDLYYLFCSYKLLKAKSSFLFLLIFCVVNPIALFSIYYIIEAKLNFFSSSLCF
jgi:hypothetical protein